MEPDRLTANSLGDLMKRRFGNRGLWGLAILSALGLLWWSWSGNRERPGEDRNRARMVPDDSPSTLGGQAGDKNALDEAVSAHREALKDQTRARMPLQWAASQNNLGTVLSRLGERESGTERLEQAVAVYRQAIEVFTPQAAGYFHDHAQTNLDRVLAMLEQRRASLE